MLKEPVSLWCNRTCTLVRCENPSGVPAGGSPIESKAKWRVGAFAGVNAPYVQTENMLLGRESREMSSELYGFSFPCSITGWGVLRIPWAQRKWTE